MKIVYNRRFQEEESYDSAFISHLEDIGYEVDSVESNELSSYDFSEVGLLIVGAPGTGWVANHPEEALLADLEIPIMSMCRGTSRNAFNMATATGTTASVSTFTVVDTNHPITEGLSGSITIGSAQTVQRISSLTAETNLIMEVITDGAGIAEIIPTINGDDYPRIHFGYHHATELNSDGWDIFDRVIEYLLPWENLSGSYISAPVDLSLYGESNPPLKTKWMEHVPEDSEVTVEVAITGKSGGTPIEPIEEDWEPHENGSLITNLPPNLTDKYLWIRVILERISMEIESPSVDWMVVYDSSESSRAAVRIEFYNEHRVIDSSGTTVFTGITEAAHLPYSVFVLPLEDPYGFVYLTEGTILTDESKEVTIIIYGAFIEYAYTGTLATTSVEVDYGTPEHIITHSLLDDNVPVFGTQEEEDIASISWSIPGYDAQTEGTYQALGELTLPPGWVGTPEDVEALVIVLEQILPPPAPPSTGLYNVWTKKKNKWVRAKKVSVKKRSKWVPF